LRSVTGRVVTVTTFSGPDRMSSKDVAGRSRSLHREELLILPLSLCVMVSPSQLTWSEAASDLVERQPDLKHIHMKA
jgi:hypothetical protein